ncbi:hypothetical protein [Frankia canadensis]|uniref:hypothetical protein n=1 Tax=Frankia canadensis TaxID=1836972 RepID=UPI001055BD2F|nr:hypothetical protein [Frankia canadensis]
MPAGDGAGAGDVRGAPLGVGVDAGGADAVAEPVELPGSQVAADGLGLNVEGGRGAGDADGVLNGGGGVRGEFGDRHRCPRVADFL